MLLDWIDYFGFVCIMFIPIVGFIGEVLGLLLCLFDKDQSIEAKDVVVGIFFYWYDCFRSSVTYRVVSWRMSYEI